jgi:hypothetical protein
LGKRKLEELSDAEKKIKEIQESCCFEAVKLSCPFAGRSSNSSTGGV